MAGTRRRTLVGKWSGWSTGQVAGISRLRAGGPDLIIVNDRADAKGRAVGGIPLGNHTSLAAKLQGDFCNLGR